MDDMSQSPCLAVERQNCGSLDQAQAFGGLECPIGLRHGLKLQLAGIRRSRDRRAREGAKAEADFDWLDHKRLNMAEPIAPLIRCQVNRGKGPPVNLSLDSWLAVAARGGNAGFRKAALWQRAIRCYDFCIMTRSLHFIALLAFALGPATAAPPPPNLVLILADDLGWSDTTLFGQTRFHETPNLERLASRGMLFRNAYSANPLCSPTRASILTGLDPGRIGITVPGCHLPQEKLEAALPAKAHPSQKALTPTSATRLSTNYFTLPRALKRAGYVTGHFGKWHLGPEPYSALQHGFDVDVPHYPGPGPAGSYVAPWKFPPQLEFAGRRGEHIEERMADEAVRFIHANQDRPFYLNYWAFSVHAPFDGKRDLIEKYRQKANPADEQRCPVYGAMVQSLDEAVGQLLDTLDTLQLSQRTIVVFFSDNGGNMYNRIEDIPPTSNRPLRGGKATLFEGGTRVPCAFIWPGKAKPRSTSDALLSSTDFYPTILAMLGLQAQPGQRFDGVSQVPALLNQRAPRETAYCFFPHYTPATGNIPGAWVRRGDWKLIRFFCDGPDQAERVELYNLREDLGETRDLAFGNARIVKELDVLLGAHLRDTKAIVPKPNPAYDPAATPPTPPARRAQPAKRQTSG